MGLDRLDLRPSAMFFALVAASVLLTSCGLNPGAGECKISVDSADLVQLRKSAGIPDCATAPKGRSELADVAVACLGSSRKIPLSSIKGPAVINFWSSNCIPCRKEMPALAAFDKAYGDQVKVIGIDYADTYPGAALDLARQSGVHYPSLADPCGDLPGQADIRVDGLPTFYFIGADGSVSKPKLGGLTSEAEVKSLVEDELGITLEAAS